MHLCPFFYVFWRFFEQIRQKMENQEQEVLYSDISGKNHFSEGCGVVMSNNKKKHQEPELRGEKIKSRSRLEKKVISAPQSCEIEFSCLQEMTTGSPRRSRVCA